MNTFSVPDLLRGRLALGLGLLVASCSANLAPLGNAQNPSAPPGSVVEPGGPQNCAPQSTAVPKLLRVSNVEYQQMVSDLLGSPVPGEQFARWTPISQVYGFDNLSEARIDAQGLEEQYKTIEALSARVADPQALAKFCPKVQAVTPACDLKAAYNPTADFSTEQGKACWNFRDSGDAALVYDMANSRWRSPTSGALVWASGMHPGSADAVRRWTAPASGALALSGAFRDVDPGGGDGVTVSIKHNGAELYRRVIANGSADSFDLKLNLKQGDAIDFVVNATGTTAYDSTGFEATLNFSAAPATGGWTWANCAKPVLTNLASRAFRRPMRPEELVEAETLFTASLRAAEKAGQGSPFLEAVTTSAQAILLSPNVMFKPELVPQGFDASEKQFAVASRLSLFFRGSVADDELWTAAIEGQLDDVKKIEAQARRLLSLNGSRFTAQFGGQWLDFRPSQTEKLEPLEASMERESLSLFQAVLETDLLPQRLMKPGFTVVDEPLAKHYGLGFIAGGMPVQRIETTARGGLFSQGHFLTRTATGSDFRRVIHRGQWTLTRALCQTLPRLDAATLDEISKSKDKIDRTLPLSEQMALHRQAGTRCPDCHKLMDPIGLALEKFDSKGLWREVDSNGHAIVNDFEFEGAKVADPIQLADVLSESSQFRECAATKLLTYALNRGPTESEACLSALLSTQTTAAAPTLKQMAIDSFLKSLPLTELSP
jgi:Protein of unknown function (DUF1592)/Protein of unknown function (DUF1588)/Protein of unknown function (DUF1595)/Protein of unknown function (DUF1585)